MARLLDSLLLNTSAKDKLLLAWNERHLPHALLFTGNEGDEKSWLAKGLAQSALCERGAAQACGECGSCQRVEKETSESVLHLYPEKNVIKIEQARQVLDFLSLQAIGRARFVVIHDAQTLNPSAANALLKAIEEPPAQTYFFIFAASEKHVMSTIRSRCQIVRLRSPDLRFRIQQDLRDPDEKFHAQTAGMILQQLHQAQGYLSQALRERLRDRESFVKVGQHLSALLRDALFLQQSESAPLRYTEQMDFLKNVALWPKEKLAETQALAQGLELSLRENRDLNLVFEEFWIRAQSV